MDTGRRGERVCRRFDCGSRLVFVKADSDWMLLVVGVCAGGVGRVSGLSGAAGVERGHERDDVGEIEEADGFGEIGGGVAV